MCSYVMANLTKLMVLVSSVAKPANPKFVDEIAKLCTQVERAYKRAVSNPFIVPGSVRALLRQISHFLSHPPFSVSLSDQASQQLIAPEVCAMGCACADLGLQAVFTGVSTALS
jgi:hypothetical protein